MTPVPTITGVKKIAVLRANAVGDLMFSLPALHALRAAYPQAEIVLLGQPWHVAFLSGRPGPVNRVIAVPLSRGIYEQRGGSVAEDPARLEAFFGRAQAENFDLALQMHGGGKHSNPFLLRLGARFTVGLRTPDAAPLDRNVPYQYWQHEILRCLEVVAHVGAPTAVLEPWLSVTEADLAEAQRAVPEDRSPLVALHPGAGDPRRRWSAAHFAEVGRSLLGQGARVVVTGAGDEAHLTRAVVDGLGGEGHDLAGQLSLGGLAGLLSRCALVVSNDSGPLHLGGAVGASTVGIFWCGNAINAGALTRSRHRPLLSWRLECPVCGVNCMTASCAHQASFVDDVRPRDVLTEAQDLLAAAGVAAPGAGPATLRP